jgi:C1A family cysteine protease
MKSIIIFAVLFAVALANIHDPEETQFRSWMREHTKTYAGHEYRMRLSNYKENIKRNAKLNAMPGQKATFGINKFSDMSLDEFKATYLLPAFNPADTCEWPYHADVSALPRAIPKSFDWRTKGAVTPIKNQGSCGSCWTFSTAENVEGQWQIAGNALVSLSEQWIVDCSTSCLQSDPSLCNGGCNGGLPWLAYGDIITNKGLPSEANYPYQGVQGTCQTSDPAAAKISNWTYLNTDPTDITTYMYNKGPLSICLNAGLLFSYTSGVITGDPSTCPGDESDHAVLAVGYDLTQNPPYWIVKNSWGTDWGMAGYFNIESDNGLCGINLCVTSALVK